MKLWRLSVRAHADDLTGGYGLANDGRWNTAGRPCTYAASGAALPVLEKRVHVNDPKLLPPLVMVEYHLPDPTPATTVDIGSLPADWVHHQDMTQQLGDNWLAAASTPILFLPSAIVPIAGAPDLNVLINNAHPAISDLTITKKTPFTLDIRLFG